MKLFAAAMALVAPTALMANPVCLVETNVDEQGTAGAKRLATCPSNSRTRKLFFSYTERESQNYPWEFKSGGNGRSGGRGAGSGSIDLSAESSQSQVIRFDCHAGLNVCRGRVKASIVECGPCPPGSYQTKACGPGEDRQCNNVKPATCKWTQDVDDRGTDNEREILRCLLQPGQYAYKRRVYWRFDDTANRGHPWRFLINGLTGPERRGSASGYFETNGQSNEIVRWDCLAGLNFCKGRVSVSVVQCYCPYGTVTPCAEGRDAVCKPYQAPTPTPPPTPPAGPAVLQEPLCSGYTTVNDLGLFGARGLKTCSSTSNLRRLYFQYYTGQSSYPWEIKASGGKSSGSLRGQGTGFFTVSADDNQAISFDCHAGFNRCQGTIYFQLPDCSACPAGYRLTQYCGPRNSRRCERQPGAGASTAEVLDGGETGLEALPEPEAADAAIKQSDLPQDPADEIVNNQPVALAAGAASAGAVIILGAVGLAVRHKRRRASIPEAHDAELAAVSEL